jgi:hypothetical protein
MKAKRAPAIHGSYGEDFLKWAAILEIPCSRWDEPLIQKGLPLLAQAAKLQYEFSTALDPFQDGEDFGKEEMLMRCVCGMLQDKLTGKNDFGEYILGKMCAIGYVPIERNK